ncbi:MAG: DedA family protein [Bacteroidetes bacterium]|nr:DedA family protein [Bacteroidota bacterium]GDX47520.1 membrane protein [Bacteroidota bacterium]
MEFLHQLLDFIIHIDKHLTDIISQYGTLTYAILFVIIFSETGFVVTPFLPGDSLLFAAGALAANEANALQVHLLVVLLIIAAVAGNMVNYQVGRWIGPAVFNRNYKLLKREYLEKTQHFYEKHGGKTIIYSRFMPIIRTFAPFVAGVGKMTYSRFSTFNLAGGVIWVVLFTYAGYLFGNNDFVKNNFSAVVIMIIIVSLLPIVYEALKMRFRKAS